MNKNKISIFDHVYALELSLRATKLIEEANITSIAELVQYSEQELLRTPKFGRKSLNEIKKELSMMGLNFGMKLTELIEGLTVEHKKCNLRCQEIEKQVNELLGYDSTWKKK